MTKSEFIIQSVLTLNKGNTDDCECRVGIAIEQYNQLIENNIKFEPEYRWCRPKPDDE